MREGAEACEKGLGFWGSLGVRILLFTGFSGIQCRHELVVVEETPWLRPVWILVEVWSCHEFLLQYGLPPKTIASVAVGNNFFDLVNLWDSLEGSFQSQPSVQILEVFLVVLLSLIRS